MGWLTTESVVEASGAPYFRHVIREFVYVDVTRVRSLLAQLDWGVVEGAVSRRTYGKGLGIGAGMFGVSGTASLRSDQAYEESRTLGVERSSQPSHRR